MTRPSLRLLCCATGLSLTLFASSRGFLSAQSKTETSAVANHIRQGRLFEKEKHWAEAEREFRAALQINPHSGQAAVGHAETLVELEQPFDAQLELQSFLEQNPNVARAHELYAVLAISLKDDFILAEREMEKCVKLAPNNGMAWKSLGDIYMDHTTPSDAIRAYQHSAQLLPQDPLVLAALANAYAQDGDNQKAGTTFLKAVRMSQLAPDSSESRKNKAGVQYLYGRYLLDQNHPKESMEAINRALAFNPRSAVALYLRAKAYESVGDYKRAETDALQAFAIEPRSKEGPLQLVSIYRKLHDPEKAQQYAEIAQKLVDEEQSRASFSREVRRLLGVAEAALREQRFSDAIPPYEDLIQKVPTFYEAYFGLGMCYSQTNRIADAEAAFRKYLSMQKLSGDGHAMLGIVLLQEGRGREAAAELQQALDIDPTLDEARKALATEYLQESKPEDSLRILRQARDTKDAQLVAMIAEILLQKGDVVGAKREVARAVALQPDNTDALRVKQEIMARSSSSQ